MRRSSQQKHPLSCEKWREMWIVPMGYRRPPVTSCGAQQTSTGRYTEREQFVNCRVYFSVSSPRYPARLVARWCSGKGQRGELGRGCMHDVWAAQNCLKCHPPPPRRGMCGGVGEGNGGVTCTGALWHCSGATMHVFSRSAQHMRCTLNPDVPYCIDVLITVCTRLALIRG